MTSWYGYIRKLRSVVMRSRAEKDVADELEAHLELQTRKYVAQGMNGSEAQRLARLEFGSVENAREECREVDRWAMLDALARNLKYAIRSLGVQRGFALVAVSILAMGIGSTLAVFNLLDALTLRPLPIRNGAELVRISSVVRGGDFGSLPTTFADALRSIPDYSGVCGFDTRYPGVEVHGSIRSVGALGFTGDCFSTLGIGVQLGRSLTIEDDQLGSEPVAVITDAFWRREFNGRRDVLGERVRWGGLAYTIVGVAEPRFNGLLVGFSEGLIVASRQEYREVMPNGKPPAYWWVNILARRAAGISVQQAAARMKVRAQELLRRSIPPHYSAERQANYLATKISVTSGSGGIDYFLRRRFGSSLYAAAGICGAILLIGCTNLINLLLARSLKRRHEIAIRFALGAKRSQLAALFAAESFLLVLPGAGFALLLARAIDVWLVAQGARMFGNFDLGIVFDWRAGVLMSVVAVAVMIAFTSASAWQANQMRDSAALKEGGRGMAGHTPLAQKILISVQIALTLALVAGSNLLAASLTHLYKLNLGVNVRNVWDVTLSPRPGEKPHFDRGSYDREILAEVHQVPGVEAATLTDFIPFFTFSEDEAIAAVDTGNSRDELNGTVLTTSADLFKTVGLRLIAGHEFQEDKAGEPAAVVSESLAARLGVHPQDLIGHHIRLGRDSRYQRLRVTGVVSNAQMNLAHPEELAPSTVYLNMWQHPDRQGYPVLLIKTAMNDLNVDALRNIVSSRGHEYVDRVRTLSEEKDGALMENKLLAYLSEAFSGLALAMAATGLFGVLSYYVANRTNEIGLRMALGAKRLQIQWMVLGQITRVLSISIGVGLLASLAVARIIQNLLFGVTGSDPVPLLLACAALSVTCLFAAWLPAWRASWIDPLSALRHE